MRKQILSLFIVLGAMSTSACVSQQPAVQASDSTSTSTGSSVLGKLFGGGTKSSGITQSSSSSSGSSSSGSSSLNGALGSLLGSATGGDNIVSNVLGKLLGSALTLSPELIAGTWNYNGVACVLESDNALSNIGGVAATAKIEEKLDGYLAKVGVKPGNCSFAFDAEGNCTFSAMGRNINGTYTLDAENKTITFTLGQQLNSTAYIVYAGSKLQIVFKADKLLELVKTVSSKSANTTLSTVSTLLSMYDGMMLGMELVKE